MRFLRPGLNKAWQVSLCALPKWPAHHTPAFLGQLSHLLSIRWWLLSKGTNQRTTQPAIPKVYQDISAIPGHEPYWAWALMWNAPGRSRDGITEWGSQLLPWTPGDMYVGSCVLKFCPLAVSSSLPSSSQSSISSSDLPLQYANPYCGLGPDTVPQ